MKHLLIIFFSLSPLWVFSQTNEVIEITWDDLKDVEYEEVYVDSMEVWYWKPLFGDKIVDLDNKLIQISGKYTLLDSTKSMLSRYLFDESNCPVSQNNSDFELIELEFFTTPYFFIKPIEGISVQGVLRLNAVDPFKMPYILENPEINPEKID